MKRAVSVILAVLMVFSAFYGVFAEGELVAGKATLKTTKFFVDGKESELKMYQVAIASKDDAKDIVPNLAVSIEELAKVLGEKAPFNFTFDAEKKTLDIKKGEKFGGEVAPFKDNSDAEEIQIKVSVDGKPLGKEYQAFLVDGKLFMRTSQIKEVLGTFRFYTDYNGEDKAYIYLDETDIPQFDVKKFEEELKKSDYSIVEIWAPWCVYSRASIPMVMDLMKKVEGKGFQYISVISSYKDYKLDEIKPLFGESELYKNSFAYDENAHKYFSAGKLTEEALKYVPRIFVLDKDGKLIGNQLADYEDALYEKYMKESGKTEDELTDEDYEILDNQVYAEFLNNALGKEILEVPELKIIKKEVAPEKPEENKEEGKLTAVKSAQSFMLNGEKKEIGSFLINGYNFYKIRDLAAILNDTSKKFNLVWNAEKKQMEITKGASYEKLDTDLQAFPEGTLEGAFAEQTLIIDGEGKTLTTAFINDNNYIKLRDFAELIGYEVGFDESTKTILITTEK